MTSNLRYCVTCGFFFFLLKAFADIIEKKGKAKVIDCVKAINFPDNHTILYAKHKPFHASFNITWIKCLRQDDEAVNEGRKMK